MHVQEILQYLVCVCVFYHAICYLIHLTVQSNISKAAKGFQLVDSALLELPLLTTTAYHDDFSPFL